MKKLLFVCYGLGIGGIEKCLVNLLNALPAKQFEVDVLLMNPEYDLKNQVTGSCTFLDSFRYVMNTTDTLPEIMRRGGILRNFGFFLRYCVFRVRVKLGLAPWKQFRALPKKYDIAVAYSQNDYSPYYVIDRVQADRKVLWYHNGAYERTGDLYARDQSYYSRFDHLVAVSNDCAQVLREKFSFSDGKILVLRNFCNTADVLSHASSPVPSDFDVPGFHITTVGRLTKEKGADLALSACKQLRDAGFPVIWHWVGNGNQNSAVRQMRSAYHLEDCFLLEGNQSNPYPYVRGADLYVQPSYYEAYSTTVTEAKVLCKPMVVTDVGGMRDQIEDGVTGWITPVDADALTEAIRRLIETPSALEACRSALERSPLDTDSILSTYNNTVFR